MQEIGRLWESHSDGPLYDISHTKKQPAFRYMRKHDFAAAIQEATAQARREAQAEADAVWIEAISFLEEAMQLSQIVPKQIPGLFEILKRRVSSKQKSLAAQPQEGKV